MAANGRPCIGIHIGAAARRQHLSAVFEQARDHLALAVAEIGLAMLGEAFGDGLTHRDTDPMVGVDEGEAELFGESAAHRRLAGAHEPDKHNRMAVEALADVGRILAERAAGHLLKSWMKRFQPWLAHYAASEQILPKLKTLVI